MKVAMVGAVLAVLLACPDLVACPAAADRMLQTAAASRRHELRTVIVRSSHGRLAVSLFYNRKKITAAAPGLRLFLKRRDCNALILDRFVLDMGTLIRRLVAQDHTEFDAWDHFMAGLTIRVDGRRYMTLKTLSIGRRFLGILPRVHRMKWAEKFNCFPQIDSAADPQ